MLDAGDWYLTTVGNSSASFPPPTNQLPHDLVTQPQGIITDNTLLLQQPPVTSSPSRSPSGFALDPSQSHQYLPVPNSSLSFLFSVAGSNPFDNNACNFITDPTFMGTFQSCFMNFSSMSSQPEIGTQEPGSSSELPALAPGFSSTGFEGFESSMNPLFINRRDKVLRSLESCPTIGASSTMFQKPDMLQQSSNGLDDSGFSEMSFGESLELGDDNWGKKWKRNDEAEVGGGSFDLSGFSYDSEELNETNRIDKCVMMEGNNSNSNANSKVTIHGGGGCDQKGKKKGMPAKNLMAERRRRKKLNDRLYMLRSVVPKISRMDRASILGDAIDYLKDLLQRINDVRNELESAQPGFLMPTTNFDTTPTPATLPCRVKEEWSNPLLSPKNQPTKVEVQAREGSAVNIHMFCARRPGLLLSTLTALESLGLDIQQAVVSCFNGFALDVFKAEQCTEGQDVLPDQIKDVLLDSVGFHGVS